MSEPAKHSARGKNDGAEQRSVKLPGPLPFLLPYLVPILTIKAFYSNTQWTALLAPTFVWVVMPILDFFTGRTKVPFVPRMSATERKSLDSKISYRLAVYSWLPVHFSMVVWAAREVQNLDRAVSWTKLLGLLWSVGLIAAEGINCSHELLHRHSRIERWMGKVLLMSVSYGHFSIEHARGHHSRVATPEDPATMRFGESFYAFLPRTVVGGYASAWQLETKRLRRDNVRVFSLRNEMILFALGQVAFVAFFYLFIGYKGLLVFVYQSLVAILLLEQINAIEHYGLQRKKHPSGAYERVGPRHSWDAPQRISNYLLFKLQIHADHHLRKLGSARFEKEPLA